MSGGLIRRLSHRYGSAMTPIERRAFIKQLAAAGLVLSTQGCGLPKTSAVGRRVIIVGAGFAGLACGFELSQAGVDVTLVEAKRRVGGRVFSSNAGNGNAFLPERNIELGAELIGSNHPRWMHYARQFQLELLDVTEDPEADMSIVLLGRRLDESDTDRLWEELDGVLLALNVLAEGVDANEPWNSPGAAELDQQSVEEFIKNLDVSELAKHAMRTNLMSDNGQSTERQSLLGLLAQIKGGGVETYWTESEVYRCKGGNDQLAKSLAKEIGDENILLGESVVEIEMNDRESSVLLASGTRLRGDAVVLSVSPAVWSKISIRPALPEVLKPQMGLNTKYFAQVRDRFWATAATPISQYALGDGKIQLTWEGTDNQSPADFEKPAVLVGFSGGPSCSELGQMTDPQRDAALGAELDQFFPGFRSKFIESKFMDWPTEPWTLASYSFPAPGQVTTLGPLLVSPLHDGRLHLAGETTCYAFVGYMEGALQSGLRVAQQILQSEAVMAEVADNPS
jgi:monoamine oxidase